MRVVPAVLASCHPGPVVAVTSIAALLALSAGQPAGTVVLVTLAVLAGQLSIGWANDVLDVERDRHVGRTDKPLARDAVSLRTVRVCLVVALVACVVLSLALGWRAAALHLLVAVPAAHAYNLGLKSTVLSWLPYAAAFGVAPAVVTLAGPDPAWPSPWLLVAGATLGTAVHLVNVLPDLDDDARTGVHGFPHRLGERASRLLAVAMLLAASAAALLALEGRVPTWSWAVLVGVVVLCAVTALGRGRVPFRAAVAVAFLDAALLVAAG